MASSSSSVKSTSPNSSAAKKSFLRRFVPVLAAANIAFIVYLLIRTSKKQSPQEESDEKVEIISATALNANAAVAEKAKPVEFPAPVKILSPIPEEEQRELFKWILEEKRKIKPTNPSDKKKIDEEKALLKEFIRSKSIPSL
ncbi:hypothetical protein HPP92_009138 [Vanilla planifolia]|uniref:Transmembrane protein n=1 Tax=Vanilla planifolia TaxID=51239 RepID=A0A835R603_VANPL|nr:hypothetical protein HPP92_009138 [Vanilla planifolia]